MEEYAIKAGLDSWVSMHLYYHEDLERVLLHFVPSLVHDLIIERQASDQFFFVRYFLGGPHLRLRIRCLSGQRDRVAEAIKYAAERFFKNWPSRRAIAPADIAKANERILLNDPFEQDDGIYADNSVRIVPFRAEVERYGGHVLLPHSLDFFCVSSVVVLDLLRCYHGRRQSEFLSGAARLLFAQAAGLASDPEHLKGVLRYAFEAKWEPVTKKADSVYEQKRSAFRELICEVSEQILCSAVESNAEISWVQALHTAGKFLSRDIRAGDRLTRAKILGSQMHMTANRMGLRNADEVYLGHLLYRALEDELSENVDLQTAAVASAQSLLGLRSCDSVAAVAAQCLSAWLASIPSTEGQVL